MVKFRHKKFNKNDILNMALYCLCEYDASYLFYFMYYTILVLCFFMYYAFPILSIACQSTKLRRQKF